MKILDIWDEYHALRFGDIYVKLKQRENNITEEAIEILEKIL